MEKYKIREALEKLASEANLIYQDNNFLIKVYKIGKIIKDIIK